MFDLWVFWIPCILMGAGIAIDVTLATLAKYRDDDLSFKNWTFPVMLTHIGFPAVGYYLFWGISEAYPPASIILGIIGFGLVSLFVYEAVCEWAGYEPFFGISDWVSRKIGIAEDDARRFIAILAVSWDAAWSGPAKEAQTEAGAWTNNETLFSFVVAGVTVAIIAQLALMVAKWLRRIDFKSSTGLARFNFWGKLVELSVIGGFGVLSLWQGVWGESNIYLSIAIAGGFLLIVFLSLYTRLMSNEMEEAEKAVEG